MVSKAPSTNSSEKPDLNPDAQAKRKSVGKSLLDTLYHEEKGVRKSTLIAIAVVVCSLLASGLLGHIAPAIAGLLAAFWITARNHSN